MRAVEQIQCACASGSVLNHQNLAWLVQNVKVAVGLEKPLGKEGAGSMEPAGMMENKCVLCPSFQHDPVLERLRGQLQAPAHQ